MKKLSQIINEEIDLHDHLSKHYNYTTDHYSAIRNYTEHHDINDNLWRDKDKKIKYGEGTTIHALDSALNVHKTPHKLALYSGIEFDPREKLKNNTLHHPAYLSTSYEQGVADEFSGNKINDQGIEHRHILKIHVPKGHPGGYIGHLSKYPEEREFILPRGTNLKYKKHVEHKDDDIVTHIHHVEPI